jgi:hypothetical protein
VLWHEGKQSPPVKCNQILIPFFSADNFADSIVDEKISISNYSLSASVS